MTVTPILFFIIAWLCGALPLGWFVAKHKGHDLFSVGSGGTGATNVWRILGWRWGLTIFAFDVLKGALPLLLVENPTIQMLGGIAALIGHSYSPILWIFTRQWRGGKSVATAFGVLLVLAPLPALCVLGLWILIFLGLRYISLASMLAAISLPVFGLAWQAPLEFLPFFLLVAVFVVRRHRENWQRMQAFTEPQVAFPIWVERLLMFRFWFAWYFQGARHADAQLAFMICLLGKGPKGSKKSASARFWWMALLPQDVAHWLVRRSPPWLAYCGCSVVRLADGTRIATHVMACPANIPDLTDRKDRDRYEQSHNLLLEITVFVCRVVGCVDVVALGAATGIAFNGGKKLVPLLAQRLSGLGIEVPVVTNGNTSTGHKLLRQVVQLAKEQFENRQVTVVLIGVGSVGEKLLQLLVRSSDLFLKEVILVGRETDGKIDPELFKKADRVASEVPVRAMLRRKAISRGDIIIYATNEAEAEAPQFNDFKEKAVLIDAGKPANTHAFFPLARPDILVVAGGIIEPYAARFGRILGLGTAQIYACGEEGLVLAYLKAKNKLDSLYDIPPNHQALALVGGPNEFLSKMLDRYSQQIGSKIACYQDPYTNRAISPKRRRAHRYS